MATNISFMNLAVSPLHTQGAIHPPINITPDHALFPQPQVTFETHPHSSQNHAAQLFPHTIKPFPPQAQPHPFTQLHPQSALLTSILDFATGTLSALSTMADHMLLWHLAWLQFISFPSFSSFLLSLALPSLPFLYKPWWALAHMEYLWSDTSLLRNGSGLGPSQSN